MKADWEISAERMAARFNEMMPSLIEFALIDLDMKGGPTEADFAHAREIGERLAPTGDAFTRGGKSAGGEPPGMGAIAKALACGAWAPGGLDFGGHHWERSR